MVYFQTKNPELGKFWRALDWKILIYFIAIGSITQLFGIPILWPLGTFHGHVFGIFFPVLVCCTN
jgi:hypothetical protein